MKLYTTNYKNTFIEIAEDCPLNQGQEPPIKGNNKSVANYQYDMVKGNPYKYTSDDVFFTVFAIRKEFDKKDWNDERNKFFSKGQPCFRASSLTKRYGWGVHSNENGKVAIYGIETKEYQNFLSDNSIRKIKAMRSKK
ncbi:MAG: hypothetical protein KDC79_13005 [Cyclobacteriaceae bacterium]|nr:hypothetical protein [Cyclobacteriaceae bacterium]